MHFNVPYHSVARADVFLERILPGIAGGCGHFLDVLGEELGRYLRIYSVTGEHSKSKYGS